MTDQKKIIIDNDNSILSIKKQCELISLSRSSYYYEPIPENPRNLKIMRLIDETYLEHPYYGTRRMKIILNKQGYDVGRDLVRTLMLKMGIEAIYPKPKTSIRNIEHRIYPYLLRGVPITFCNQVWSSDITFIPMEKGFLYLTAIIDWFSRYIIAWKLSNSLDGYFCREVLNEALRSGNTPQIFNTDQGAQYTANSFTEILKSLNIGISMDGKGRCLDNIFCERLWRTIKYEEIYLKNYIDGQDAYKNLLKYINFYNKSRPHQSLGYISPLECYLTGKNNCKKNKIVT